MHDFDHDKAARHQRTIDNVRAMLHQCPDERRRILLARLSIIERDITKVRAAKWIGRRINDIAENVCFHDGEVRILNSAMIERSYD